MTAASRKSAEALLRDLYKTSINGLFSTAHFMKRPNSASQNTRLSKLATACIIASSAFMSVGCGSTSSPEAKQENPKPIAPAATSSSAPASSEPLTPAPATTPQNAKAEVEAEITSFEPAEAVNTTTTDDTKSKQLAATPAAPPSKAATAREAIAAINFLDLPRLKSESILQSGPTYLYYSCKAKLADADEFYKSMFKSNGWEELPPLTPPTDHYIDRVFTKNGYFVRAGLSLSGGPDDSGIMLSNLGNVDVRSLPKLPDAEITFQATPVNLTYQTLSSIPDAAAAVEKEILAQGWETWREFQDNPISVPHYKDLHFRKGACRLLVGIVKNPQNPADKTSVSYISEFVTPFDIPMLGQSKTLKLDTIGKRASFDATNSRQDLVNLLNTHCESFGWNLTDAERFAAGETHRLTIDLASDEYMVARLVESAGKYSASLECYSKPTTSDQQPTDSVAKTEDVPVAPNEPMEEENPAENMEAQINAAIQGELAKALGSLGKSSGGDPKSMAELEATAKQFQNLLGNDDSVAEETSIDAVIENPFDVKEDEAPLPAELSTIKNTKCTIKVNDKSMQLPYVACYLMNDSGATIKCILFSDKPIDQPKLHRLLLKEAQPVHGMYVSKDATKMLDFRISDESLSLNAQIDSSSLGMSTGSVPTKVLYKNGKLVGTIATKEPIEMSDETLEFTIQVNEVPVQVDWTKRGSAELEKLVADESQEILVPEGCHSFSSEGSRYSSKVKAVTEAPLNMVQIFYTEQLEQKGWKLAADGSAAGELYQLNEQELIVKLESNDSETTIELQTRDLAAAKADAMLPPKGKTLLALGNMSQVDVEMIIGGKTYKVEPSEGRDPKDATKVVVEPGNVKIRVVVEKGGKPIDMEVNASGDATYGVLFDTSFQDVLRLF